MNAVYVSPFCPWPRNFGGRYRVDMIWGALQGRGDGSLLVLGDELDAAQLDRLHDCGGASFPARFETTTARFSRIVKGAISGASIPSARFLWPERIEELRAEIRRRTPDVIVLGDTYVGALIPALADLGVPVVIDTMNVESRLYRRVARTAPTFAERAGFTLLARNVADIERRLFPLADEVWAVSEDDAAFYREKLRLPRVAVIPNAVECADPRVPVGGEVLSANGDSPEITLVGWYLYPPNEAAALLLVEASRELMRAGVDHRVTLVGRDPTDRMRAAAAGLAHVTVTGEVPEVRSYLDRAVIFAAPVVSGSGTKYKILEAMAAGCPVVTTPLGAEGIALVDGVHARVVEPKAVAATIGAALHDRSALAAMGERGRAWVAEHFSLSATQGLVRRKLSGLIDATRQRDVL